MHVGFTSLREFVLERPSFRTEALRVLLDLTTHPGRVVQWLSLVIDAHPFVQSQSLAALQSIP
jgi:hypothetical protein